MLILEGLWGEAPPSPAPKGTSNTQFFGKNIFAPGPRVRIARLKVFDQALIFKTKDFSLCRTLESLAKKENTQKKQGNLLQRKKQGSPKKQGKEDQGGGAEKNCTLMFKTVKAIMQCQP